MAIEQKYADLINADVDGEISAEGKIELQAFLADSAEGRALHKEMSSLCEALENVGEEKPPVHMRHIIMNSIPKPPARETSPGFLQVLFSAPSMRYALSFAAGVFLAISIVNSSQVSNQAFDQVAGLVGTVADPVDARLASSIAVDELDVAGIVSLRSSGSLLILDFDLNAKDHIEVEADYSDPSIWFNGFAQLPSEGTTVSAESGRVRLGMAGKRRYAVYLHNQGGREATVKLRFLADGEVVHEASLDYVPAD